ncbi:helix-turn-helix domain-containing protein [Parafrankia sp. FMc2]|uniref:helix-turn-helix domain-containing protein n=1 Tax=Parafrankia sp. FMc2 TaxID=3233196 RepID=UPI0034D61079
MALPRMHDQPVGVLLRGWREQRRLTQLGLAERAGVSTRHISFVENGRSRPTREMILMLAEQLDVPLRERNQLLLAGGYAPAYSEHDLASPPMSAVSEAINRVLAGLAPLPAVVVDRHWELVAANDSISLFTAGVAPRLLEPPVNVLRLSLHPDGMAPRILNLPQWKAHLLDRLARQAEKSADPVLLDLHAELHTYPAPGGGRFRDRDVNGRHRRSAANGMASRDTSDRERMDSQPELWAANTIVVPMHYKSPRGDLALFTATTVFGTPTDVTVAELAIETFYPADPTSANLLNASPR